ncbi:class I SAM-dependent methyltransferase [Rubripirellula tenax]|uniref:class I SAM-dependent methyltransferase n=1 Tax=Rubripirellula tenax TaxID=2528015 RepID=UPI00164906F5|nr:class I SAM-dependent methyltransferase [Rubripirellula tenax]
MAREEIQSVVDIGCGDWSFSRNIDWSRVDYTGVDIVPSLSEELNREHGGDKIRFACADLTSDELPSADLCICKDVLQHLSNESVQKFLSGNLNRYRYALLTNDYRKMKRSRLNFLGKMREFQEPNSETTDGGSRPIRLTEAPFNLPAEQLVLFDMQIGRTLFTKETLLWTRE